MYSNNGEKLIIAGVGAIATAFLLTWVIDIKIAKSAASFFMNHNKYLNNSTFCHSYSIWSYWNLTLFVFFSFFSCFKAPKY